MELGYKTTITSRDILQTQEHLVFFHLNVVSEMLEALSRNIMLGKYSFVFNNKDGKACMQPLVIQSIFQQYSQKSPYIIPL